MTIYIKGIYEEQIYKTQPPPPGKEGRSFHSNLSGAFWGRRQAAFPSVLINILWHLVPQLSFPKQSVICTVAHESSQCGHLY
jgi:hypothetical protein